MSGTSAVSYPQPKKRRKKGSFVHEHSLSIASIALLSLWIILYALANPSTHLGSFFGNAIADWSGVVITVRATKYLYEKGSAESRTPKGFLGPTMGWLRDHSLSLFLIATGVAWVVLFAKNGPQCQVGPSGGQSRFGMDANPRTRAAHQTHDREALQGKPWLEPPQNHSRAKKYADMAKPTKITSRLTCLGSIRCAT